MLSPALFGALAIALILSVVPDLAAAAEGGIQILPTGLDKSPVEMPWPLIGLVAAFALLIWPVNRFVFTPVFAVLDERDARIAGAQERAQTLNREAEAVLSRYEVEVRRAREHATAERRGEMDKARSQELEATSHARGEAEGQLERARGEIGDALGEARQSLRAQAEELAREAAQRVLGRELR